MVNLCYFDLRYVFWGHNDSVGRGSAVPLIEWFYFDSLTLLFWFGLFLEVRAEILTKKLCFFFVDLKTPKGHFEINWPVAKLFLRIKKKHRLYNILISVETLWIGPHLDLMLTLKMAKKSFMQKISKEGKHLGVPNNGDNAYLKSILKFHAPLGFTKCTNSLVNATFGS